MASLYITWFRVVAAVLLMIFGSHQALAVCMAGVVDSCQISNTEAETLLRPHVDNKVVGKLFTLPLKLFAIPMPKVPSDATPAMRMSWFERLNALQDTYTFILSTQDCAQLPGKYPGIATDRWIAACRLGRVMLVAGLAKLELSELPLFGGEEAWLAFKFNEEGKTQINHYKLERAHGPLTSLEQLAGNPEIDLMTGLTKLTRVIRTAEIRSLAGEIGSKVEFEYAIDLNVWGVLEGFLRPDKTPIRSGIGTAIFEKWSDGWRLVSGPKF